MCVSVGGVFCGRVRYEAYKAAKTVGEYLALGGLKADVKFDYQVNPPGALSFP